MNTRILLALLTLITLAAPAMAQDEAIDFAAIDEMAITGRIDGANVTFTLDFDMQHTDARRYHPLIRGDVALDTIKADGGAKLDYLTTTGTYRIGWPKAGKYSVSAAFAARAEHVGGGWRQASFTVPASRVRQLSLICDRNDLEVAFPGALRQKRTIEDGRLVVTAILGPGNPFVVRWKPQVSVEEGELVYSANVNTIVKVSSASLRVDTLMHFDIPQGRLRELAFDVPASLSVTQVLGGSIRDWRIEGAGDAPMRRLVVSLAQPQQRGYDLQIIGETVLGDLPTSTALPTVQLADEKVRTSGQLAIGTDSAVKIVVSEPTGVSQIDAGKFSRRTMGGGASRDLPSRSAFFYDVPTGSYAMTLSVDRIVPTYDVEQQMVVTVGEDDLTIDSNLALEVRDAPLRSVWLRVPGAFLVTAVEGPMVEEFNVLEPRAGDDTPGPLVEVHFKQPVMGTTLVRLRAEMGKTIVGAGPISVLGVDVSGAHTHRGHVLIAGDEGVEASVPATEGLREVHTGSVKVSVAGARFAYRFRDAAWSLSLKADQRPSGIRAEAFHVVSLGEQMVYGSVAVNYFISGAPVDELTFTAPDRLKHVEFVGADVRRWTRDGDTYTVKLNRKVIGDYNLGVTYSYRYEDGEEVLAGGVAVSGVDTQTGYVVLASHLNVELAAGPKAGNDSVIEIAREEIPGTYRLLVNAPILKTYKYISATHAIVHSVRAFDRGRLLPIVVELTQIDTQLGMDEDGAAESITTIRYKIKNSSAQFLALDIPGDADVWHTHLVEVDANGNEQRTRVTASYDEATKRHMIQLPRKRNPNDPTTIDLQYARNHGEIGSTVELTAPRSAVQSTFAGWVVRTDPDWALHVKGGNMLAGDREIYLGDLASVLGVVGGAWGESLSDAFESGAAVFILLIAGGVIAVVAVTRRRWLIRTVVALAALTVLIWGISAAGHGLDQLSVADDLTALRFTQPLTLDDADPLTAVVSITPAWRQHATLFGSIVVPIVSVGLIVLGLIRRGLRKVLVPLGITGICYAVAQYDVIATDTFDLNPSLWIGYLCTWGLPLLGALYVAWRLRPTGLPSLGTKRPAATTAALLAVCLFAGAADAQVRVVNLTPEHQVEAVEVTLSPEGDSMNVEYHIKVSTEATVGFDLLDTEAVLDSIDALEGQREKIRVVTDGGKYRVVFTEAGHYDVKVKMFTALGAADGGGQRSFSLPVPPALSSRATLRIAQGEIEVESPNAIRLKHTDDAKQTVSTAMFAPGDRVRFNWKPRVREVKREKVVFFADVLSAVRFDTARATGRHRVKLQIAQGEVTDLKLAIPAGQVVTDVSGPIGGWRFDPASNAMAIRLSRPFSGTLELIVTTEMTSDRLPWSATLRVPTVDEAQRQMGSIGLLTSPAVYIETPGADALQPMTGEDFARAAGGLLKTLENAKPEDVRHAFRIRGDDDAVSVRVHEVKPELRSMHNGAFSVEDDRLVLNAQLNVEVLKAGVFSVDLVLPADYDIDTLDAPGISHWDPSDPVDGVRRVTVHLQQKTVGTIPMTISISQPITKVPESIAAPRIGVVGSVKHTGQLVVQAERGLRLSASERSGVSELNPADLGLRGDSALAYRLLQPDWSLTLAAEVVEPRITIDALHVAEISEGLVRHHHQVRFQMAHAGAKVFQLHVPTDALGLSITGPDIANTKLIDAESGLWRVELARKYFDRPLLLSVRYETRFDMAEGKVDLAPVRPLGGDLYRGYVAVRATEKVELKPTRVDAALQPAESRSIPGYFPTAGLNLADAAYTYSTPSADATLAVTAERHGAAEQLGADVRAAMVTTVVNERGQSINRVQLQMRVGSKRQLEARLPEGADVWSLTVNNRAVVPSIATDKSGAPITLVPLAHSAGDELDVMVELIYVMDRPKQWSTGSQRYEGPRFDLPLRNVRWVMFVPEGYDYSDFTGTLAVDEQSVRDETVYGYGLSTYQEQELRRVSLENQTALRNIAQARDLAARGEQQQAKAALESAYHYSFNDVALNEDARVQLHRLNRQQAMVGLWSRRGLLRPQQEGGGVAGEDDANYSQQEADNNLSRLDRADSDNLEKIAMSFIEAQEQAAGATVALSVHLPLRGRAIEFHRPVQIEPDAPMHVAFDADVKSSGRTGSNLLASVGLFAGVALFSLILTRATRRRPAEPETPAAA